MVIPEVLDTEAITAELENKMQQEPPVAVQERFPTGAARQAWGCQRRLRSLRRSYCSHPGLSLPARLAASEPPASAPEPPHAQPQLQVSQDTLEAEAR